MLYNLAPIKRERELQMLFADVQKAVGPDKVPGRVMKTA